MEIATNGKLPFVGMMTPKRRSVFSLIFIVIVIDKCLNASLPTLINPLKVVGENIHVEYM